MDRESLESAQSIDNLRRKLFDAEEETPEDMETDSRGSASEPASSAPVLAGNNGQHIAMFARVRPLASKETEACMKVGSAQQLMIMTPTSAPSYKTTGYQESRFVFTRVFDTDTTQKQLFDQTVLPLIEGTIRGHDGLCFAYGMTGAGKSYTIHGTRTEPGIIYRAVDVLFNSLEGLLDARGSEVNDFSIIVAPPPTPSDKKRPRTARQKDGGSSESAASADSETPRVPDNTAVPANRGRQYKVFLTYVEVYNEVLYDLLMPLPKEGDKRQRLELRTDKNDRLYVAKARRVQVSSREDAERVLRAGQQNRQTFATALNVESSRSHSIFAVTVETTDLSEKPTSAVTTSRLSFVDLAGSERHARTNATGARLKEASNINTSLMTLGKCLEALRWNQAHAKEKTKQVVPFRDSKLTRIFGDFYENNGKVVMIVNVSPAVADYDETLHVLKFSAIAKDVTTFAKPKPPPPKVPERKPRNTKNMKSKSTDEEEDVSTAATGSLEGMEESSLSDTPEKTALMRENDELRLRLIESEARAQHLETEIRTEASNEMALRLEEMQTMYEKRLNSEANIQEEKYDRRLSLLAKSTAKKRAKDADAGALARELAMVRDEMIEIQRDQLRSKLQLTAQIEARDKIIAEREETIAALQERLQVVDSTLHTASAAVEAALQAEVADLQKMLKREKKERATLERQVQDQKQKLQELTQMVDEHYEVAARSTKANKAFDPRLDMTGSDVSLSPSPAGKRMRQLPAREIMMKQFESAEKDRKRALRKDRPRKDGEVSESDADAEPEPEEEEEAEEEDKENAPDDGTSTWATRVPPPGKRSTTTKRARDSNASLDVTVDASFDSDARRQSTKRPRSELNEESDEANTTAELRDKFGAPPPARLGGRNLRPRNR